MLRKMDRNGLLSIGAFGRLVGLSEKTLRRYAQIGLLPPARVDPATAYRWYSPDQLEEARLVALLRQLDMPVRRIREVLGAADAAERWHRIRSFLSEQWQSLAEKERVLARLHSMLTGETLPVRDLGPFEGLEEAALRELSDAFVAVSLPADVPLFEQGDSSDALFVLQSGSVRIVIRPPGVPHAEPLVVGVAREGSVVGEMGVLDGAPRSASIYTNEPSELLKLMRAAYQAIAAQYPEFEARLRAIGESRRLGPPGADKAP